jgi:hypothetical protein
MKRTISLIKMKYPTTQPTDDDAVGMMSDVYEYHFH